MSWNPFTWFPLTSDGQSVSDISAEQASISEREALLNQRRLDSGYYTVDQFQAAEVSRLNGKLDVGTEVATAAAEGASEGLAALPGYVRQTLNTSFGWSLSFVPLWAWLVGLVALAWYLGAFPFLRGILAKR